MIVLSNLILHDGIQRCQGPLVLSVATIADSEEMTKVMDLKMVLFQVKWISAIQIKLFAGNS